MSQNTRYVYSSLSKQNIQLLLNEHGFSVISNDEKWLDSIINFLHTIVHKVEIDQCDENQYVNLHSDILGEVYGKRKVGTGVYYRKLIDVLKKCGIIDTTTYTEGVKSTGYRITAKFTGALVREIIDRKNVNVKKDNLSISAIRHLESIKKIAFNIDEANQVIERLHLSKRLRITSWVYRWAQVEHFVTEDTNGRIYSNITGLNKEFRGCMSLEGQDLYSVDVKQAHPYFFIDVISKTIKQNTKKSLADNLKLDKYQDVSRYIDDVRSNTFLSKIHQRILDNNKQIEMAELKVGVLAEVFYQRLKKVKHKIVRAFSDLYPNVWHYISLSKAKDHKDLAQKLMSAESRLMNRTIKRLYEKFPDEIFIRLHDAVITTKHMQDQVKAMLQNTGADMFGFAPMVTMSKFNVAMGQIEDHPLNFEELNKQFAADKASELNRHNDRTALDVYTNAIDWTEYEKRINLKNSEVLNRENIERWLKESCMLKL